MAKKQIILFALIVCLPLAALAWLGARLARHEEAIVRERFRELLAGRLEDVDRVVRAYFQQRQRELLELTELESFEPDHIRGIVRGHPHVGQLFVLNPDGTLLHPDPAGSPNDAEREFLRQSQEVFLNKELLRGKVGEEETALPAASGWYVQYWGPGLHLIFYHRLESGQVVGVLLPRSRWIADLITELPETVPPESAPGRPALPSRICLVDSGGKTVYQWGPLEPAGGATPLVESRLSEPLGSWRLRFFVDPRQFAGVGQSAYFNLFSALLAIGVILIVAAACFYRGYARQIRDALQRVNFVNQVSHELKTPLTNIRMYAELLQGDLDLVDAEEAAPARGHLEVIVAESQRLSRLIGNVLTFARERRGKLALRKTVARVDEVIGRVIERFQPAFAQIPIEVTFNGSANSPVSIDVDALEQILGNLFSNVEKYAAAGGRMDVVSRQEGDNATIEVADRGPGIPANLKERVFQPFYRISDSIDRGTGTGIGLAIARRLARLHGGDVALLDSEGGARFLLRLHAAVEPNQGIP